MTSEVQAALIGAVSGAAFGALASLLVNSLFDLVPYKDVFLQVAFGTAAEIRCSGYFEGL